MSKTSDALDARACRNMLAYSTRVAIRNIQSAANDKNFSSRRYDFIDVIGDCNWAVADTQEDHPLYPYNSLRAACAALDLNYLHIIKQLRPDIIKAVKNSNKAHYPNLQETTNAH